MKTMQKFGKNITPTSTSLACSSADLSLNREETLSEQVVKTSPNSLEENLSQHRGSSDLRVQNVVYVLNMRGQPLMPTTQQKANKLLKLKKAKVISRKQFTIQLKYATGEAKQKITLGIDSGYSKIGFSAVTNKEELISGEVELRKEVSKKLQNRAMYRRNRRGRLWHRKPRFNNRVKTKKKGWLAPSLQHKLDTHVRLMEQIKGLLPITKTIVEVASFDTQKMQNPEISRIEYQQGELQGYEVREYLLEKFGRKCIYCGKKNIPLQIEHIVPKSRGGSNRVSNLTIACEKCNLKKGNQTAEEFGFPNIQKQAKESLKSTAFMNIVRKMLVKQVNAEETYGYVTKHNRIKLDLPKTHYNDAFVIAGTTQERSIPIFIKQVRRNNRSLQLNRKGYKPSIRRQRYKLQPNDLIEYQGKRFRIKGTCNYGKQVRLENDKYISTEKVKLIKYAKGLFSKTKIGGKVVIPHRIEIRCPLMI